MSDECLWHSSVVFANAVVIREYISVSPLHGRSVGIRVDPKRQVMNRSRKLFVTSEADLVIQTMRAQTKMTVNTNEKRVPTGMPSKNTQQPEEPQNEYY